MKKILGITTIVIVSYAIWIIVEQERQAKAVWTKVTDTWE